ncbi:class E sortase [Streptomyces sp. NBC_01619]|uniref:class E sortase n=1 Tax=Streptomyces sp. NBC_01619 TaxID=2975901 RepID=UPI00224DC1C6|nr:class E sortase [Streptomyces sp. NBC_01619]MCX4515499.1 class E sortase [Streptomyces sp. NBC_01619]
MHHSRAAFPAFPAFLTGAPAVALAVLLAGCSPAPGSDKPAAPAAAAPAVTAAVEPAPAPVATTPSAALRETTPSPAPRETAGRTGPASVDIPSIGVDDLRVVPYEGTTDDWPGTRIQNRGVAASPYGEQGGVGPGEIGNYLVTGHRLSAGGPLRELPSVRVGDADLVTYGGKVYEYRITESRKTSFRSARSLTEQRAAVPGSPGKRPTQAMITISTCATPEDNAAGNFWRDDRSNPEHRIDRVGVLTGVRAAAG